MSKVFKNMFMCIFLRRIEAICFWKRKMKILILIWKTRLEMLNIWFEGGTFWSLRTLWRNLHMFLDIETFVSCVWNCVKPLFTPLEVQFKKEKKIQKHTPPSSEMLDLLRRWHLQGIDKKNQGYFQSGPYKSQFCVKLVDVLLFQENWLAITFTWQNEP